MKILIWIGCMVVNYFMQMAFFAIVSWVPVSDDGGAVLVGLLNGLLSVVSIGLCIWIAIRLCKKWDWHKVTKKANEAGMTVTEYGKHGLSEEFLAKVETLFNTVPYEQAKPQLKACVKKGKITKEQYIILLEEYSTIK